MRPSRTAALPLGDYAVAVYRWPALVALLVSIPILWLLRGMRWR